MAQTTPPRDERNISVRLDQTTDQRLRELVAHFNSNSGQVVRHAIDVLYKRVQKEEERA